MAEFVTGGANSSYLELNVRCARDSFGTRLATRHSLYRVMHTAAATMPETRAVAPVALALLRVVDVDVVEVTPGEETW